MDDVYFPYIMIYKSVFIFKWYYKYEIYRKYTYPIVSNNIFYVYLIKNSSKKKKNICLYNIISKFKINLIESIS